MDLLMRGIRVHGFLIPVLIDAGMTIIAGHARVDAARRLGLELIPVVRIDHLSPEQIRVFRIADNRIAELSSWDDDILRLELTELMSFELTGAFDIDLDLTGFCTAEIDVLLDSAMPGDEVMETVELPDPAALAVTCPGDLWIMGDHRLVCGNALDAAVYVTLMGDDRARLVFTAPPTT